MFYKKEDVDSALICSFCSEVLRDPRILPCGISACHECIQSKSNADTELDCLFCKGKHLPPDRGDNFYPNLSLLKLIESKAESVTRNQNVESLESKLAEIKMQGDQFNINLQNGVDEVQAHCSKLRNQVDLRTEILIQQVHQFNDKLMAEIDEYERECIDSYGSKIKEKDTEFAELLAEINKFYAENTRYLKEFKLDNSKIEESLEKADGYLEKLNEAGLTLRDLKFNGELIEFTNSEAQHDTRSLLGELDLQHVRLKIENLKEIQLGLNICPDYERCSSLFRLKDGTSVAFYMAFDYKFSLIKFDDESNVLSRLTDLFPNCRLLNHDITMLNSNFVLHVYLHYAEWTSRGYFRNREMAFSDSSNSQIVTLLLDENMNYLKHVHNESVIWRLAANRSYILFLEVDCTHYFYDSDLNILEEDEDDEDEDEEEEDEDDEDEGSLDVKRLIEEDETLSISLEMTDRNVFILDLENLELKIFDLETFDLVKVIDVDADQMKLVAKRHLALFNSRERVLYLYDQVSFEKKDEINLEASIEHGFNMAHDSTSRISFCNQHQIKWFSTKS
jgi:hypothetical protein